MHNPLDRLHQSTQTARILAGLYVLEILFLALIGIGPFVIWKEFEVAGLLAALYLAFIVWRSRGHTPARQLGLGLATMEGEAASRQQHSLRLLLKLGFWAAVGLALLPGLLAWLLGGHVDPVRWRWYVYGLLAVLVLQALLFVPGLPQAWRGRTFYDLASGTQVLSERPDRPLGPLLRQMLEIFLFALLVFACGHGMIGFPGARDRAKISNLRQNMHMMQTMVETYYADHQRYPANSQVLKQAAIAGKYWKQLENPFYPTEAGYLSAEPDWDPFHVPETHWLFVRLPVSHDCRGAVMYRPMDAPQPAQNYRIFACDAQGWVLPQYDAQPLVLQAENTSP
ncbi:MAG: hypothetical protein IGS03_07890 [Candidatus Sericytochromatia bacterium]|nr:hypothetical protein [Candidatus Sericytochromatia bacterium]